MKKLATIILLTIGVVTMLSFSVAADDNSPPVSKKEKSFSSEIKIEKSCDVVFVCEQQIEITIIEIEKIDQTNDEERTIINEVVLPSPQLKSRPAEPQLVQLE